MKKVLFIIVAQALLFVIVVCGMIASPVSASAQKQEEVLVVEELIELQYSSAVGNKEMSKE